MRNFEILKNGRETAEFVGQGVWRRARETRFFRNSAMDLYLLTVTNV